MDEASERAANEIERLRERIGRQVEHLRQIGEDLRDLPSDLRDAAHGRIDFADLQYGLDWAVADLRALKRLQAQFAADVELLLPMLLRESRRCRNLDLAWDDVPAALRPAAALVMEAHLDKLELEGKLPELRP